MRTSGFSLVFVLRWSLTPFQSAFMRTSGFSYIQFGRPVKGGFVSIRLHADKWLQPTRPAWHEPLRTRFNPPSCGQVASAYPPQPTQINIELRPTSECKALHLTIQTSSNAYFTLHPYILLLHQSSIRLLNLIRHFSATQPPNKRSGTLRAPLPVLARRSLKRLAFVPNGR